VLLDEHDKAYLRNLGDDPVWHRIIKKLRDDYQTPRYRPNGDEKQTDNWKYRSGCTDTAESLLALLSGQPINHEENSRG
jgi:hypothetical protein